MPSLGDLPVEVLTDHLLQRLPISDLLNLGATSKVYASLCGDDTLWKRRLQSDFNFTGRDTARTSGWKFIYKGLSNPRVYVWGEKSKGRLGLSQSSLPNSTIPDVPFPVRLRIPGARIVSLTAGGMSFHALDSDGNIHVWGTLDGTGFALNSDGFSQPGKTAHTPLKLQLPRPIRTVSCGRLHTSTLDSKNQILTFCSWGRPFSLSSPLFNAPNIPTQVECGWNFSAALTKAGDVLVWWPFKGTLSDRLEERNEALDRDDKKALPVNGGIGCTISEINVDPVVLPSLPPLPELDPEGDGQQASTLETKLIQIGGLDECLVGLTNKGHVLKFDHLEDETTVSAGSWQYLPKFCELERVRSHSAFSSNSGSLSPPTSLKITHISAHYMTFTVYSTGTSSIVLMGDPTTTPDSDPKVIPALQNKSVIAIVLGDYHCGALTSTGKLLTWGQYSRGALGLGDPATLEPGTPGGFQTEALRLRAAEHRRGTPPDVEIPTEVKFGLGTGTKEPKNVFCLSAAAAGWHTGSLVIDQESDDSSDESEEEIQQDTRSVPAPTRVTGHGPGESPPFVPFAGGHGLLHHHPFAGRGRGFRIGYPGRGFNRGGSGRGDNV